MDAIWLAMREWVTISSFLGLGFGVGLSIVAASWEKRSIRQMLMLALLSSVFILLLFVTVQYLEGFVAEDAAVAGVGIRLLAFAVCMSGLWGVQAVWWARGHDPGVDSWDYKRNLLCAGASLMLFGFGRYVIQYSAYVNAFLIDLALGIFGTWLVTRLVMPWAITELYLSLDVMKDGTPLARNRIVILLAAAFVAALFMVISIVLALSGIEQKNRLVEESFELGRSSGSETTFKVAVTALLVAPLLVFALRKVVPQVFASHVKRGQVWMAVFVGAWICAAVAALVSFATFSISSLLMISYFSVFAGIFAGEGYVRNGGKVFGNDGGVGLMATGVVVGCCVALSMALGLQAAYWSEWLMILLSLLMILVGWFGWSAVGIVLGAGLHRHMHPDARKDMEGGITQDCVFGCVLAVFFGMAPLIMLSNVGVSSTLLSFVLFYAGFVAIGAGFIVDADVEHALKVKDDGMVSAAIPPERRASSVQALMGHIMFHWNIVNLFLFPLSLLQLLELPVHRMQSDRQTNLWESRKKLADEMRNGAGEEDAPSDREEPGAE